MGVDIISIAKVAIITVVIAFIFVHIGLIIKITYHSIIYLVNKKQYKIIATIEKYTNYYNEDTYKRYSGRLSAENKERRKIEILNNRMRAIDSCYDKNRFSLECYLIRMNSFNYKINIIYGIIGGATSSVLAAIYLEITEKIDFWNNFKVSYETLVDNNILPFIAIIIAMILSLIIIILIVVFVFLPMLGIIMGQAYKFYDVFDEQKHFINSYEVKKIKEILYNKYNIDIDESKMVNLHEG